MDTWPVPGGYGLILLKDGTWGLIIGGIAIASGDRCVVGQWTHLALVCERGKSRLWVNGQPMKATVDEMPNMPGFQFAMGSGGDDFFDGDIDEVRLSLSAETVSARDAYLYSLINTQ